MLVTLNNCHAIFASNHKVVLPGNGAQRHTNKGAQQIAERRPAGKYIRLLNIMEIMYNFNFWWRLRGRGRGILNAPGDSAEK